MGSGAASLGLPRPRDLRLPASARVFIGVMYDSHQYARFRLSGRVREGDQGRRASDGARPDDLFVGAGFSRADHGALATQAGVRESLAVCKCFCVCAINTTLAKIYHSLNFSAGEKPQNGTI